MAKPAWLPSQLDYRARTAEAAPDMWEGKALPDRNVTHTNINYRLYDRRTGTLLSFNSTNSIAALVADVLRTRDENPTAQITAVEYDGPAFLTTADIQAAERKPRVPFSLPGRLK